MRIVFFSNFLNHHQLPLCEAFIKIVGHDNFKFVATMKITQERIDLGYQNMNLMYPFVIREYEGEKAKDEAEKWTIESDLMILGAAPIYYQKLRLINKKIVFHFNERFLKHGKWALLVPKVALRAYKSYLKDKGDKLYVLCAGAYLENDLRLVGFDTSSHCFKWGYFPEVRQYDVEGIISQKKKNSILWVGRLINWKHPEYVLKAAKLLKDKCYSFEINIIGNGPLYESLKESVSAYELEGFVNVLGVKNNDEVRHYMERSQIFLFTSNRREGWGAVLNEAMNSGCVPVASHMIGAVPYMIQNEVNGLVFESDNVESLYEKIQVLLDNPLRMQIMAKLAYMTMVETWNANNAAESLLRTYESIVKNCETPVLTGPGSPAGHYSECFKE